MLPDSVFVSSSRCICTPPVVNENLRGGGSFSFLYTFHTTYSPNPSFWKYRAMKEGILPDLCLFFYVQLYVSWEITIGSVSPALPLSFHHIFWFSVIFDRRMMICMQSVSASATYQLWVAAGLNSCCLFCGVTASVALRNRKSNWLLSRLRVEGGLLSAVSPEQWKTTFFSCWFFSLQAPCALCKTNIVSENPVFRFILICLRESSKTKTEILTLWSNEFRWASAYRHNIKESLKYVFL